MDLYNFYGEYYFYLNKIVEKIFVKNIFFDGNTQKVIFEFKNKLLKITEFT